MTDDGFLKGHNDEQIEWKVFSSYIDTFEGANGKIERIPKRWKAVVKCKDCGRKKTYYYNN